MYKKKLSRQDLLNFAKGKELKRPGLLAIVERENGKLQFDVELSDAIQTDIIVQICKTAKDVNYFRQPETNKQISQGIESRIKGEV